MDKEAYKAELSALMDAVGNQKPRLCDIPGLGKRWIREITIGEVDEQIADTEGDKGKRGIARGACRLLAYEDGERIYDPDNEADVTRISKLKLSVLTAINATQDLEGATKGK